MSGILIIAHAPLASSLKTVALHTYPDCALTLEVLDVAPDMPLERIEALAAELLARVRDPQALLLTDVFGATPCNVAQRLAATAEAGQVRVVTGLNVPMLWRVLCYRHEPLDALVARAVAGATQGVMQVSISRPQNQATQAGPHDPSQRHHQQ